MATFSKVKDLKVADDATKFNPLMCRAAGCPNRWSVAKEGEQPLCSSHAWADPHLWPVITQELIEAETDRAVAAQRPPDPRKHVSRQEALQRLAKFKFPTEGSKAWARRLLDRHAAGERIPLVHLEMARGALGHFYVAGHDAAVMGETVPIAPDVLPPGFGKRPIGDDPSFPPAGL